MTIKLINFEYLFLYFAQYVELATEDGILHKMLYIFKNKLIEPNYCVDHFDAEFTAFRIQRLMQQIIQTTSVLYKLKSYINHD